jgi:secreted Zn-dependent insulinase-like peptidase
MCPCRYEQPYSVEDLPADWVDVWKAATAHPALALPMINPFTPKHLDMLPESAASGDEPVRVYHDDLISF